MPFTPLPPSFANHNTADTHENLPKTVPPSVGTKLLCPAVPVPDAEALLAKEKGSELLETLPEATAAVLRDMYLRLFNLEADLVFLLRGRKLLEREVGGVGG
jgi:hypothetical protein